MMFSLMFLLLELTSSTPEPCFVTPESFFCIMSSACHCRRLCDAVDAGTVRGYRPLWMPLYSLCAHVDPMHVETQFRVVVGP